MPRHNDIYECTPMCVHQAMILWFRPDAISQCVLLYFYINDAYNWLKAMLVCNNHDAVVLSAVYC